MDVKSSESVQQNDVIMENGVLHPINVGFRDNLNDSQKYLPPSIHHNLHQNCETQQDRNQFQESAVQEFNHGDATQGRTIYETAEILPAACVRDVMTGMLADEERNLITQFSQIRESPDWSLEKNSPVQNAASTFWDISVKDKQEVLPHSLNEKKSLVHSNLSPETFTTEPATIKRREINEEIEMNSMDIDYFGTQDNETFSLERRQMTMSETAVNYPIKQNDENQTFANSETTFGRYVTNEPIGIIKMDEDCHYTAINKNNRRKKFIMQENMMNKEHESNNSIYAHPTASAYYNVKENAVFEPVTVVNEENGDTVQANMRTILDEILQTVVNQENRFLQRILESALIETNEHFMEPEFMPGFRNSIETPDEPQPMEY